MDESLVAQYPELEREHFWWATRRELVTQLVGDMAGEDEFTVLDVGCGSGMTARALAHSGASVVGVDLETHGTSDVEGVTLVKADYLQESPHLGQFEAVMALDAVEHFPDEDEVVEAMASNLVPGGHLVVTVPAYQLLWSSHDVTNQHYRRYTSKRLRRVLEAAGLEVDRIGYVFAALTLPKMLLTLIERVTKDSAPTGTDVTSWPNRMAAGYFGAETRFAASRKNFLPFGTSVVAVARRPH